MQRYSMPETRSNNSLMEVSCRAGQHDANCRTLFHNVTIIRRYFRTFARNNSILINKLRKAMASIKFQLCQTSVVPAPTRQSKRRGNCIYIYIEAFYILCGLEEVMILSHVTRLQQPQLCPCAACT